MTNCFTVKSVCDQDGLTKEKTPLVPKISGNFTFCAQWPIMMDSKTWTYSEDSEDLKLPAWHINAFCVSSKKKRKWWPGPHLSLSFFLTHTHTQIKMWTSMDFNWCLLLCHMAYIGLLMLWQFYIMLSFLHSFTLMEDRQRGQRGVYSIISCSK